MKDDIIQWLSQKSINIDKSVSLMWERSSVEPAILRLPVVVLFMLFLWGIDIWIFERIRLQYYNVLMIRTGLSNKISPKKNKSLTA